MSRKAYTPKPEDLELVQRLKEVGSTDKEIARVLAISYTTFKKYKNDLFDPYILKGKEIRKNKLLSMVDDEVKRMISGYFVEEIQKQYKGDKGIRTIVKSKYVRLNTRL